MTERFADACVVLTAVLGGLLFGRVFGVAELVVPLVLIAITALAVAELSRRRPAVEPWRPVLVVLGGTVVVIETVLRPTTTAGVPTGATLRALTGVTDSWQRTLQSTWPARPDPELVLFVPALVVLAGMLALELRHRFRAPLFALLPGLALAAVSQLFAAVTGGAAVLAAVAFAVLAAGLLIFTGTGQAVARSNQVRRPGAPDLAGVTGQRGTAGRHGIAGLRGLAVVPLVATVGVGSVGGAALLGQIDPGDRPAYTIKDDQAAPVPPGRVTSPLGDIARRLGDPTAEVFRYRTDAPVDRWRLVVLDRFDGINWGSDAAYRRLGAELRPGPAVTVPTDLRSAEVTVTGDLGGPWLPSQAWPASVSGTAPLVDESSGALRSAEAGRPRYTLGWHSPAPTRAQLAEAEVDPTATSGLSDLGGVPDDVLDLATEASGGYPPSFRTALRLERFLRGEYARAVGKLPTGHSWPQLRDFLLGSHRGTPEQFAAAYVVLARLNGIPARLVVGFQASAETAGDGSHVVRNGQVTAWPEVALRDIGWWPLDPAGANTSRAAAGSPAGLTDEVRQDLPPKDEPATEPDDEPDEPPAPVDAHTPGTAWPAYLFPVIAAVAGVAVLGLLAVPVVRWARSRRRRRRTGAAGIAAAWSEARDRLRSHGVNVTAAMTVRDLIHPAEPVGGQAAAIGLRRLAHVVDHAIWSGADPDPRLHIESWAAVAELRRALRTRTIRERLRATFDLRSLLPPR